jgi:hypothetical protein
LIQCDGITLSTATDAVNQIVVYYAGHPLRKDGVYYQETASTYDSIPLSNISTMTVSTVSELPTISPVGTAYRVTDTNKVWVYTGSRFELDSVPGYVYSGIRYRPADFTINTQTQSLILNTATVILKDGIRISIIKKQYSSLDRWNTIENNSANSLSIMDSNTVVAKFLQAEPAELPDSYYYGGDRDLTDDSGEALTTDDDQSLKGF